MHVISMSCHEVKTLGSVTRRLRLGARPPLSNERWIEDSHSKVCLVSWALGIDIGSARWAIQDVNMSESWMALRELG